MTLLTKVTTNTIHFSDIPVHSEQTPSGTEYQFHSCTWQFSWIYVLLLTEKEVICNVYSTGGFITCAFVTCNKQRSCSER